MQTTAQTIPAGTPVQTTTGRRAVTLDDSIAVRNSETGQVTVTNRVKFSDDDQVSPGGEWTWNTQELTPITDLRALRLVDTYGHTVAVRYARDEDIETATRELMDTEAPKHAAKWASFGFDYDVRDYRIV
jgi:hypothetical protein